MASRSRHCNSWDIVVREKWTKLFDTQHREIFSTTFHFEKEKSICLTSYTVKTKSKGKKNVVVLSTSRPLHGKTIDDSKEKSQIIKFYDFTTGGTDIVDQLKDCYNTRLKFCRWVMVALSYKLDTARFNKITVWCLKNDSDISSTSSYDFSWNLAKALALPHVQQRTLNGLASSVQLRMKMFLGTALLVDEPVPKVKGTGQRRCQLHMANCHTKTEKDNAPKLTEQRQSCSISICREHSMRVCHGCLRFYISYSLCLAFRLCCSMIVVYTSLEVIKLAFLENKSSYVCCIFPNFIFTFEKKS